MAKPKPARLTIRLSGSLIHLRPDTGLIATIDALAQREARTSSDLVRLALARAFPGEHTLAAIDAVAGRDRRDRADVIRIALQDAYQPDQHQPAIYPPKRRA